MTPAELNTTIKENYEDICTGYVRFGPHVDGRVVFCPVGSPCSAHKCGPVRCYCSDAISQETAD